MPLFTFGEVKGLVYFVMGYVRGESLGARIKRSGRLRVEESRRILSDVADALAYAHTQGVVHRDIKPDNILIDADSGRPMLTDFGVAKALSLGANLTDTGLVVGTPHYMSPEQAAGRTDIDGRSDLYSLGVMGYAMLAGRLPFEGKTPGDVLVQHLTKEPPPLQAAAPGLPYALTAALMRSLAKDPSQRWPDAKSLKQALNPDESAPELPAKLRALAVSLQVVLVTLLLDAYISLYLASDPNPLSIPGFLADPAHTTTVIVGATGVFAAIQARRRLKLPWSVILRSAVLQPGWWPGWYPRALRRPGDLWDRLPFRVRAARQLVAALIVAWVLLLIPFSVLRTASGSYHERTGMRTVIGSLAMSKSDWTPRLLVILHIGGLSGLVLTMLWLRRRLGDEFDFEEMPVLSATWKKGSPWRKPAYQTLLRPVEAAERTAPESEADLEKGILALANAMPSTLAPLAQCSLAAARSLRASMAALAREMAALIRDADPLEAARLEEKLSALGPAESAEPPSRREMRELLAKQLSLVRGLAPRLEAAQREQARRVELLRTLWHRMSGLQAELSQQGAPAEETTAQIRALCAEIERRIFAEPATVSTPREGIDDLPTLDHQQDRSASLKV